MNAPVHHCLPTGSRQRRRSGAGRGTMKDQRRGQEVSVRHLRPPKTRAKGWQVDALVDVNHCTKNKSSKIRKGGTKDGSKNTTKKNSHDLLNGGRQEAETITLENEGA